MKNQKKTRGRCHTSPLKSLSRRPRLQDCSLRESSATESSTRQSGRYGNYARNTLGMTRHDMLPVSESGRVIGQDAPAAKYLDIDVEHARELWDEGYTWPEISQMLEIPIRTLRDYVSGQRRSTIPAGWRKKK